MTRAVRRTAWCLLLAFATVAGCRGARDDAVSGPVATAVANVLASAPADDEADAQVKALAALGAPAVAPLGRHVHDPDERTRLLVVHGLGAIGGPDAVDPLLDALADPSWTVRLEAVRALGTLHPARAVDPLLRLLDGDAEAQVRYEVLTTLGLIGDRRASPRLVRALHEDDPYLRMWAMDALCTMRDPDAPALLPGLLADPDLYVRRQVVRSCHASARTDASRRRLVAMTLDDPDFESAVVAREALADDVRQLPADDAARAFIHQAATDALASPDPGRARRGAFLLGNLGDRRATDALLAALADQDPLMRHHAAYLLGQVDDARAVAPLVGALHDGAPLVRATAIAALREYAGRGNDEARRALGGR